MAEPGSPPHRGRIAPIPTGIRVLQALAITVGACLVVVRFVQIDAASGSTSDTLRPSARGDAAVTIVLDPARAKR